MSLEVLSNGTTPSLLSFCEFSLVGVGLCCASMQEKKSVQSLQSHGVLSMQNNNPLRFETTKCSKQRIEQASIRTLFPKCVHKLGSLRFVLEAVF